MEKTWLGKYGFYFLNTWKDGQPNHTTWLGCPWRRLPWQLWSPPYSLFQKGRKREQAPAFNQELRDVLSSLLPFSPVDKFCSTTHMSLFPVEKPQEHCPLTLSYCPVSVSHAWGKEKQILGANYNSHWHPLCCCTFPGPAMLPSNS